MIKTKAVSNYITYYVSVLVWKYALIKLFIDASSGKDKPFIDVLKNIQKFLVHDNWVTKWAVLLLDNQKNSGCLGNTVLSIKILSNHYQNQLFVDIS